MNAVRNLTLLFCLSLACLLLGACAGRGGTPWPADAPSPPRYCGTADAPGWILLYSNPQCPPCRRAWASTLDVSAALDPERTKLFILGRGFDANGTRLLFLASLLAEQNAELGLTFLSDIMTQSQSLTSPQWTEDWLSAHAGQFDDPLLRERANSEEAAVRYLETVLAVRDRYALSQTPSVVINGRLHSGPMTAEAILHAAGE